MKKALRGALSCGSPFRATSRAEAERALFRAGAALTMAVTRRLAPAQGDWDELTAADTGWLTTMVEKEIAA